MTDARMLVRGNQNKQVLTRDDAHKLMLGHALSYNAKGRYTDASNAERILDTIMRIEDYGVQARMLADLAGVYAKSLKVKQRPAKKKNPTVFEWVAYAVSTCNKSNLFFQYVRVTPDRIEASDGRRLHRANNTEGLKPGYYLPNGTYYLAEDEAPWQWPNTDRVIPDEQTNTTHVHRALDTFELRTQGKGSNTITQCILPTPDNTTIARLLFNQRYLIDLYAGSNVVEIHYDPLAVKPGAVKFYPGGSLLDSARAMAVVMPMQED